MFRSQPAFLAGAVCACALGLSTTGAASAQMIWGGEVQRGFSPGPYFHYDNMPLSHRNFDPGPIFYLNGDARNLWHMDYLDRWDRALKNGYPLPHYKSPPPSSYPRHFGLGTGFFRLR